MSDLVSELRAALASPNVAAFLRVIRAGETSQGPEAYYMLFGGERVDGLAHHPRRAITRGSLTSTAAGAYQFLSRTWAECVEALKLPDFGPASQDLAAVFLIRRRGALADVLAGRVEQAIAKCAKEWASLPGSPYGQPTRTMAQALETYARYGGVLGPAPASDTPEPPMPAAQPIPQPQEPTMAPFIPLAFEAIASVVPALIKHFGSGSEVAERNAKAVEIVVEAAKAATGAANEQQLVEQIKAGDPQTVQAVQKAVEGVWYELTEVGGGVKAARAADLAFVATHEPVWRSPSFLVAVALLPLVYMIVGNVVGVLGQPLSDEVRSAISNGVVGLILGGLIGYYYGQTTSRNRAPAG